MLKDLRGALYRLYAASHVEAAGSSSSSSHDRLSASNDRPDGYSLLDARLDVEDPLTL